MMGIRAYLVYTRWSRENACSALAYSLPLSWAEASWRSTSPYAACPLDWKVRFYHTKASRPHIGGERSRLKAKGAR